MSYVDEWKAAIERTKRFNLRVPPLQRITGNWFDEKRYLEFPYVVQEALGELGPEDLVAQCLSIHYRLAPVLERWLGCPVAYTIGWIDDMSEKGMFRFNDDFIEDKLRNPVLPGKTINIHAWLTLPSMEVIDVSLATTIGKVQNRPEMYGLVISKRADDLEGMAYKPMLVGDDFLLKTGLLKSVIIF
ncbi:hypothetical protein [Halomonas sp. AOP35-4E-18]|uniref:hypothetical protein n=1 Tax=Halomonas sp. AOP35-4E-18 TaxID=3457686 RepID=UPI0040342FC9